MYTKALEISEGLLISYNPIQNKKFKLKKKRKYQKEAHQNEISGFQWRQLELRTIKKASRDFPGGRAIKTPHFQFRGSPVRALRLPHTCFRK